jgi:predicted DNA-binding protein
MPTKNPRVNVTFNPNDAEVMQLICEKKKISMSALVRKVVEDWLEEYEDMLLARRAEEAEKRWIEGGRKTISHEELCRELGIESNMEKTQEATSKNSLKTSKKGSSEPSSKGLRSRHKSVNP